MDTLKHEKDSLAIDKSKLKGDLKSTEKELKKVTSSLGSARSEVDRLRGKSHKHGGATMGVDAGELQERVMQLEAELAERNEKLATFRRRIGNRVSRLESGKSEGGSSDAEEPSTECQSSLEGTLHAEREAHATLEREAHATLERENSELHMRVRNLEGDLNQLLRLMDDQQREEFAQRAQRRSREGSLLRTTFSADALNSTYSELKRSGYNTPSPFSSPKNSPILRRRRKTSVETTTLQSCLKLALEEKKMAEQQMESLQRQLNSVRGELEKANEALGREKDALLQQLQKTTRMESEAGDRAEAEAALEQENQQLRNDLEDARERLRRQESEVFSQQHTWATERRGSVGSTASSPGATLRRTERRTSVDFQKADAALVEHGEMKPKDTEREEKEERPSRRRGSLKKQNSRENFAAARALFQGGATGTCLSKPASKQERSTSETSTGGNSGRSSLSPAPSSPNTSAPQRRLSVENKFQLVSAAGKPPIHPASSSSGSGGSHSRQHSADEVGHRSPARMSTAAKRMSWTVAQRRQSFEEQPEESASSMLSVRVHHTRTASSPIMSKMSGDSSVAEGNELKEKLRALEEEKKLREEKAAREREERRQRELEAEEKRKKELEERRKREAEETDRLRREKEEREKERKRELEERRKTEAEEKERLRKMREERKKEMEEREKERKRELEERRKREAVEKERLRKEREEREKERKRELEEKRKREVEEREEREKERKRELEEKRKREAEERERKRQQELDKHRQLEAEERERKRQQELDKHRQLEEKRKQEQARQKEVQRQKEMEREKERQREREAALKAQREADEQKKREKEEQEKRLQLEEEKRRAEKAAQVATDPQPSKARYNSPFGSVAQRRQAFEQNQTPTGSPAVVLRRNVTNTPAERPKSMDFSALMSTSVSSSPPISPSSHNSPRMASISVKSTKSPQTSPLLNQRKEIKEVTVNRLNSISKPNPPVTAVGRAATVSIVATASSPPLLRRAQTISSGPTTNRSLALSTPDLTSVGTGSGSSSPAREVHVSSWSPGAQRKTVHPASPKSPLTEKKMVKSVSFCPSVSAGIPKPNPPLTTTPSNQPSPTTPTSKPTFKPVPARLAVPAAADIKKTQSLQDIPEHDLSEPVSSQPAAMRVITGGSPVAPRVQRRPRAERPKTTSLSRADTVNLANLITKLQVKEKGPSPEQGPGQRSAGSGDVPVGNGVAPTPRTGFTPAGRPASMYGSITPTR